MGNRQGWIEGEPGVYRYDDYDRLMELARDRGLQVIISTIAEIQPFWIHRLVPGAELVDSMGRAVVSCLREECNVGLTPGGCFDHPEIATRMGTFISDVAVRYGALSHLAGWDCWNETRWNVHAEALTCFCEHTLAAYRTWLRERYGDLDGLNAAWHRRYDSWEDVRPSKRAGGPFCDNLDFGRFHAWRTAQHARFRYDAIRVGDATHIITAHGPMPTIHTPPVAAEVPMCRGNDWDLADVLDGVGASFHPVWQGLDAAHMGTRLQEVRAAAGEKVAWISEMQASSSTVSYLNFHGAGAPPVRVSPLWQQRWLLEGLARDYDAVLFWAWRDEVFCREAGNDGLVGRDGLAAARLAGIRAVTDMMNRETDLLREYRPDSAHVGILFCPDSYLLNWGRSGNVDDARWSVVGYALALERLGVPYTFVEVHHLNILSEIDVLLVPWCQIMPDAAREAIANFVERGGTLLVEAETDAFDANGIYRYGDERPLMNRLGVADLGRRPLPVDLKLPVQLNDDTVHIELTHFATPLQAENATVLATDDEGQPMLLRQAVGHGLAYVLGGFAGRAYYKAQQPGFEALITQVCAHRRAEMLVDLGVTAPGKSSIYSHLGNSGDKRVLWLFNTNDLSSCVVNVNMGEIKEVCELLSDRAIITEADNGQTVCPLTIEAGASAVLCWTMNMQNKGE